MLDESAVGRGFGAPWAVSAGQEADVNSCSGSGADSDSDSGFRSGPSADTDTGAAAGAWWATAELLLYPQQRILMHHKALR